MAVIDVGNRQNFPDKRAGRGTSTSPVSSDASLKDVAAKRARLTAISATTFTSARLDAMTENDMDYAIRLNDDLAGI